MLVGRFSFQLLLLVRNANNSTHDEIGTLIMAVPTFHFHLFAP